MKFSLNMQKNLGVWKKSEVWNWRSLIVPLNFHNKWQKQMNSLFTFWIYSIMYLCRELIFRTSSQDPLWDLCKWSFEHSLPEYFAFLRIVIRIYLQTLLSHINLTWKKEKKKKKKKRKKLRNRDSPNYYTVVKLIKQKYLWLAAKRHPAVSTHIMAEQVISDKTWKFCGFSFYLCESVTLQLYGVKGSQLDAFSP